MSWIFIGRTDAEAETPVLWLPHVKSWLIGKDCDAGRDWGQEKKGTTEDKMPGWHHWLDGRESEWTPGVGAGQGGLACCNSWGHKESDTTEQLNWTELNWWCHCLNYSQVYSLGFFTFQAISTGYEEKVIVAVWFGNFHKASPTPSLIHWSPSLSVCLWLCTMIFAFLSKSAAARFGGHHEGHGNLVYLVLLSTSHLNVAI